MNDPRTAKEKQNQYSKKYYKKKVKKAKDNAKWLKYYKCECNRLLQIIEKLKNMRRY